MAEKSFEYGAVALETTRGTAVTPPTHIVNGEFTFDSTEENYEPDESRGTLEVSYRDKVVRRGTDWGFTGGLDLTMAPVWLNMVVKAVSTPTTPSGATLSRLWTFIPTITADDLKSATLYWGDPNNQILRATYAMADEMTIGGDSSGTDGTTMGIKGKAQPWTEVSAPTLPAVLVGDLITPGELELWMDDTSAIGTTPITGRVVSANHTIQTGVTYKHLAQGPGASLGFVRTGRVKRRMTTSIAVEFLDLAQYNYWKNKTVVKARVRHNGPLIETGFYNYLQADTYGRMRALKWGLLENSNRTLIFDIMSEYNSTLGASFAITVQNARTSL